MKLLPTRPSTSAEAPPDRSWSAGQGRDRHVFVHCFRCREPVATQRFATMDALALGKWFALCADCYGLLLERRKGRRQGKL